MGRVENVAQQTHKKLICSSVIVLLGKYGTPYLKNGVYPPEYGPAAEETDGWWGRWSTRRGTECQSAAYKHNGRCRLHWGLSTGARTQQGLQRISEANLRHGRQTKDKLAAQRHVAMVRRRVMGELKQLERQLAAAGPMPDG